MIQTKIKYKNKRNQSISKRFFNQENPEFNIFKELQSKEHLIFYPASVELFYNLEEEKADYYKGYIVMESPASIKHEMNFVKLITKIVTYVDEFNLGQVLGSRALVVFDSEHQFEPDIVFISKDNPGEFKEYEFLGIPDLVVEILSKSTRYYDLIQKNEIYQKYKVKEIIFIDNENMEKIVYCLKNSDYIKTILKQGESYTSLVLDGFVF
jgi:Uma2 family endonuclease